MRKKPKSRIVKICSTDTLVITYKRLENKLETQELSYSESLVHSLVFNELKARKVNVYNMIS